MRTRILILVVAVVAVVIHARYFRVPPGIAQGVILDAWTIQGTAFSGTDPLCTLGTIPAEAEGQEGLGKSSNAMAPTCSCDRGGAQKD